MGNHRHLRPDDEASQQKLKSDFNNFTVTKANDLAKLLNEATISYKILKVKDHDINLSRSSSAWRSSGFSTAVSEEIEHNQLDRKEILTEG